MGALVNSSASHGFVPVPREYQRRGWVVEHVVAPNPDGARMEMVRARRRGLLPSVVADYRKAAGAAGPNRGAIICWHDDGVEWSVSMLLRGPHTVLDIVGVTGLDNIVYAVTTGRAVSYFERTLDEMHADRVEWERKISAGASYEEVCGY